MSNLVKSPKSRTRGRNAGSGRRASTKLAARHTSKRASKEWKRRGRAPVRFSRLRSALSILERKSDGHHVVAYDPTDREVEVGGRRAQRRSPRGREEPRQPRGRRVSHEGDEDLDEVVRTSRRRSLKTENMAEGDVDKIQIEVGSVKGLEAKHSVYHGAFWITLLSLFLWWIPILGPAVAGYVGGRKAGTPLRGAIAAFIPIMIAFGALAVIASSTTGVTEALRNVVGAGYAGTLGTLPADIPVLGYVLSNLAAIMNSGPDALFVVLAFALVGGLVTQMKIQERSVPPITARMPASRVASPIVPVPARSLDRKRQAEVDDLVARMNEVLAGAEKERKVIARERARGASADGLLRVSRFGWLHLPRRRSEMTYEENESGSGDLAPAGREVVSRVLASTPPGRGERRAKAGREPAIDFELPQNIAFASPSHSTGAEGRAGAHNYRPSKLYHIYGSSVNPVARAKLEKRLRRTHTLHVLRRHARAFNEMVEENHEEGLELAPEEFKPRSLEASALTDDLHYDALEHLENASFPAPVKHNPSARAGEDDLGGLIAHLGEGGEAVVDSRAVEEIDHIGEPVFDRRGRQRARIAGDAPPTEKVAHKSAVLPAKPHATPAIVREAIQSVERKTHQAVTVEAAGGKTKIAKSADRAELTSTQKEKVDRWLKRTLAGEEIEAGKARAAPKREEIAVTTAPTAHEALVEPAIETVEARKPSAKHRKADEAPPAFDIVRGSAEVDAEAASTETDTKKNRSAAEILREIRLQKKAEKDAEAGEEVALAKRARGEADEIERHVRASTQGAPIEMVALHAETTPAAEPKGEPAKRKHRSPDLEEVETDSEKLGSDLELTLAPIREESVEITEVGESSAENAHVASTLAEAGIAEIRPRTSPPAVEAERDVKPGEVVLAGPSTDAPLGDSGESELSHHDQEKIRKRLQEGWNRL